jgi:hypothetical protein
MTVPQKSLKESAFPGKLKNEGVAFYAWENPGQPDTVPVYRITQGGAGTKTFYSTDLGTINRLLAEGQNDADGWKRDQFAGSSFIAFYAYPPNYAVAKQPNPYDCTIQANYVSDRCSGPRAALDTAVAAGNVPVGNDCPATLEIYRKAPFASQFDQACQDKWNTYMNDCSVQENFVSDRCKVARQAFVDAEAEQARQRAAAAAAQSDVPAKPGVTADGGCTLDKATCAFLEECKKNGCPNFNPTPTANRPIDFLGWGLNPQADKGKGTCTITYDRRTSIFTIGFGGWTTKKYIVPNKITRANCMKAVEPDSAVEEHTKRKRSWLPT